MQWQSLPPLSALRAFAAYAQTGSVAEAGAALNVSHAAISQQMRSLESHLRLRLLDRSGRSLVLTADGAQLARALDEGFGRIVQEIEQLTAADEARPLSVACTPSFAATWLMPRLGHFRVAHPGTEMMIYPSPARTDPEPGGIDVALRYGHGDWPGLQSELLIAAPLVVVGAPELFPDGPPDTPAGLLKVPWLQELGTHESTRWLKRHGVTEARTASITHVPGNLMIDGARAGQGIAVTTRLAVEDDIATGRLLLLFEDGDPAGYHICTRPGAPRPALKAFIRWLRREVGQKPDLKM